MDFGNINENRIYRVHKTTECVFWNAEVKNENHKMESQRCKVSSGEMTSQMPVFQNLHRILPTSTSLKKNTLLPLGNPEINI